MWRTNMSTKFERKNFEMLISTSMASAGLWVFFLSVFESGTEEDFGARDSFAALPQT
jgi:hypothetical protein